MNRLALLLFTLCVPLIHAQEISISSSHIAQLIYPDETLTLTITASPEPLASNVLVQVRDQDNEWVSEELRTPDEDGRVVCEISGLDAGLWLFHVRVPSGLAHRDEPDAWTRIAVVPRPDPTITAEESPIGVDAWLAWRFPFDNESVERATTLMRRIGIHWVRDRLAWHHVQPARDEWNWSQYDDCYRIQSEAGLQVIPVFHDVARWASPTGDYEPAHRPTDLDHLTRFTHAVAARYSGVIAGVEIANEFNSPHFWRGGSHDFAAYTKAAAAGLWQGDPDMLRLLGSSTDALDRAPGLADIQGAVENNVLAFVDAVTPHHYGPMHGMTTHIDWYREHAPEHPAWVTETGSTAIPEVGPFISEEEREQADYLVEAFERALDAGAEKVFYFCLTNFYEHGERPFGLVECDGDMWIPRLGLVELARLAATTRIDERCTARVGEREDREIPLVHLAMIDGPKWEIIDTPEPRSPEERFDGWRAYPFPMNRGLRLNLVEGETVPELALFPTADSNDAPWSVVDSVREWVSPPGADLEEPPGDVVSEWQSTSPSEGIARMREAEVQLSVFDLPSANHHSGELWTQSSQMERRVFEAVSRHDSLKVLDRVVIDTPIDSPIDLSCPSFLDVQSEDARVTFTVTNTTDVSREVTLSWGNGESPRHPLAVSSLSLTVAAQSSVEAVFPALADAWAMDSGDEHIQCNTVTWVSGDDRASGEAVPEWNAIAQRGQRVLFLDGILEDWMGTWWWEMDATRTVVGPPSTGWASLRAAWDDEALWLAAVVHDDDLLNPAPIEQPWTGDSMEIYLDLNAPADIGSVGYNGRVFQLQIAPALPELPQGSVMFSNPGDHSTEGIEHITRSNTRIGLVVMVHEMRIPWATLGLDSAPSGGEIGFDWAVNDLDTEGMSRSQLVWRGSVENWRDPSGFARIHLVE